LNNSVRRLLSLLGLISRSNVFFPDATLLSQNQETSLHKSRDLIKKINKVEELKYIELCQSFLHEWNIGIILDFPCDRYNNKGKEIKQNEHTHTGNC